MVFTAAQTTAFFEGVNQMVIPHDTMGALANEGIIAVQDLLDFNKDSIAQIADNMRKPGDRIANPDPGAPPGSTIPRPPYMFGAKSQQRLLVACELVRYYETVGQPLTAANMHWNTVDCNF